MVKGALRWRVWVLKEGWRQQGSRLPQRAVLSFLPSDRFQKTKHKTKQEVPSLWRWLSTFSSELMSRYPQLGNRLNKGHSHIPESVCSPGRAIELGHPDYTVLNPGILKLSSTLHHCQASHSAGKSNGVSGPRDLDVTEKACRGRKVRTLRHRESVYCRVSFNRQREFQSAYIYDSISSSYF